VNPDEAEYLRRVGVKIRQARRAASLTQGDVFKLTDITLNTIYRIEYGKTNPSLLTIRTLAVALAVGVDDLVVDR
jgi:DNA-binding XRE family transcriptional regulator